MTLLVTTLPATTIFWLIAPALAMFLIALIHSLKNWNRAPYKLCPRSGCRTGNDVEAKFCNRCGGPL